VPWRDIGHHRTPDAPLLADPSYAAARDLLREEGPCEERVTVFPPRRADRRARLATVLDALLAAVERSPDAADYAAAFAALHYTGRAPTIAGVDSRLLRVLLTLSDLLLAASTPCRRSAKRQRQPGIVRRGDAYPFIEPTPADPSLHVCRLIDERSFLVVPHTTYVLRDWDGDPHRVSGPIGDRGEGLVSRDPFRAAFSYGLSKLYKRAELLRDADRRGRFAQWPYPTRLAGLVTAGSKEDLVIDVREHLRVRWFGPPPACDDEAAPFSPAASAPPPLPGRPLLLLEERDEFEGIEIAEVPLLMSGAADVESGVTR
jgi:hypothetical protein